MIQSYLSYRLSARDEHALHSPFLYDLYTRTIRVDDKHQPIFAPIQTLRRELRRSTQLIDVTDYGTGPGRYRRSVGSIARKSLKDDTYGRLLHRLVRRFESRQILDLGTSLGITTAYMAKATEPFGGRVVTVEGCPQTATVAGQTFARLGCQNVQQVVGNLDAILTQTVAELGSLDLVFFDANHQYEPTVQYFSICLDHIHNDSVFILDDIHWSSDMERAWQTIQACPRATVTIDLFAVGLVFFRREQPKQHFILRF